MTILLYAARLSLPTLFFGYAVAANLSLLTKPFPDLPRDGPDLLSGGLALEIETAYKSVLPHVPLSFGLIGAARYGLLHEARQGAIVGAEGWIFTAEETRPMASQSELDAIIAKLRDVRDALRLAGTDLVVVPVPAKIDIARAYSADRANADAMEALYARFVTDLARTGIEVVNARTALGSGDDPGFFATDTHWNAVGVQRVAEAVATSGTIAHGSLTYRREPGPEKTLTGDLVAFVTTPGLAPGVGLAPETVVPFVQTPLTISSDIFGDPDSDIILVGTSYSANPDLGFADALMRALGRDVINLAEQGRGPFLPMQVYLASDDFAASPPAVVIWEIPIRYLTDPTLWQVTGHPAHGVSASMHGGNLDG